MARKVKSITGMHDIFGTQHDYFDYVRKIVTKNALIYGFEGIEFPIIENIDLFTKAVGAQTDVVEKEMFSFKTKGEDVVALRPEGTASVVRSYIEHSMYTQSQPVKFFYFAPFFRYERPQAGRYRQFWQFGFEVIGKGGPIVDAQVILVNYNILKELGIKGAVVEINSMGDEKCRADYKKELKKYLKEVSSSLCTDCKRRMKTNPLRCLDCKVCKKTKETAPQIVDHLCGECKDEFRAVLELLDEVGVPYELNPFLVRGLDYYSGVVYEFFIKQKDEGTWPLAVGGGGRYNGLTALLGDEARPATGAALGVERVIQIMRDQKVVLEKEHPAVFIAQLGDLAKKKCLTLFEELKKSGIPVAENFGQDSLKGQLSKANKVGAKLVIIIGKEEAANGRAILRNMENGEQDKVKISELVKEIKDSLKKVSKK